jgi:adenylate kinase family enzyme
VLAQDSPLSSARRIAIVGIGGSGKSTLAREVAARTGLPLFHMDQLFWRGNWEEVPESEYLPQHAELVAQEAWIIEGYIDEAMAERVRRADLVIWLDYPGWLCLWRVLRRWIAHRKESRPELPAEAREEFIPRFWWTVLLRRERRGIVDALSDIPNSRLIRMSSATAKIL